MNVKKSTAFITCCLAATLAWGCAAQESTPASSAETDMQKPASSSQVSSSATSSTPEKAPVTFGTQAASGLSFSLTNKMGKAIKSFAVKQTGTEAYLPELTGSEATLPNGQEAQINIPSIDASTGASGKQTKPMADLRVTTEDGSAYELHQIDVTDITDATIRTEGNLAYLEYTSLSSKAAVSTLAAEKAWLEGQASANSASSSSANEAESSTSESSSPATETEQAPAEEAVSQAPQEAPAPAAQEPAPVAQEPAPVVEEPTYQEPVYQEPAPVAPAPEEPAYVENYGNTDAAVGGGNEEECVPDIILR